MPFFKFSNTVLKEFRFHNRNKTRYLTMARSFVIVLAFFMMLGLTHAWLVPKEDCVSFTFKITRCQNQDNTKSSDGRKPTKVSIANGFSPLLFDKN